jgi:hypothetical protein
MMRIKNNMGPRGGEVWRWARLGAVLALVCAAWMPARASVSILLEQPYGDLSLVNPAGHAAVYLDNICADGPLKLRPCLPGEMGVVISRYDGVGTVDWVATPLVPYLYAVDHVAEIPDWVDKATVSRLRDEYRRAHLAALVPDGPDGKTPGGNWYELAGSAYDRTIYGFRVNTTPEQDAMLIALFNDRPNKNRYNGAFTNCADFVRVTINRFYPHAIRRNFIADLGMTTPKSVARGLAHYAKKHPETGLTVFVVPQVKGTLPRSHQVEGFSEGLIKRYGIPLVLVSPTTAAVSLVAYVVHGRFAMPKDAPELALHDAPGDELASGAVTPVTSSVQGGEAIGWHTGGMFVVNKHAQ